jgi:CubicO group peptidase (beta-lactamase class C family)
MTRVSSLALSLLVLLSGGEARGSPPAVGAGGSPSAPAAPVRDTVPRAALDSVFLDLDRTDRPGCAVGVTRDGRIAAARGYGMANLEYGLPIETSSVFHVASVSKQFTAFAVGLLVAEGRVSWDDGIREYVPELPDEFGRITLDHLAHHTSGLRDQWELLIMAGWRWEADVVRQRDVLDVLGRQRGLNFPPGTDWLYSNSGYTLLAAVVERVTGRSLREFARERIFDPLGMDRTVFRDDHETLIPDRAYAYAPDPEEGWKISIPDFAIVGASSLFTTVEDLAKWERNLRTGEVGGRDVVDGMLHRVRIGGERHGYGHGLFVDEHRGLRTVSHGGADAGYRSQFLRYPDHGLSVAVLCNDPRAGPAGRARSVAELYLAGAFPEPGEEEGESGGGLPPGAPWERLVGWYASPVDDLPVRIAYDDEVDAVTLATGNRSPRPLEGTSDSTFRVEGGSTTLHIPGDPGEWGRAVVVDDGAGPARRYRRARPADTSRAALAEYEGWYWSDELGTFYRVREAEDGGIELWQRRHGALVATPMHRDAFSAYRGFLGLTFTRDGEDRVDGFTVSGPRTWKVTFRKVERPAP